MNLQHFHTNSYASQVTTAIEHIDGDSQIVSATPNIFYPGGGGQPPDKGEVSSIEILSSELDGQGRTCLRLAQPIKEGLHEMKIDWVRRYDHMQQHSSQHLVSQILEGFGIKTVSFAMSRGEITVSREGTEDLAEIVESVERIANEAIRNSTAINIEIDDKGYRSINIAGFGVQGCGGTHISNAAELQMLYVSAPKKDIVAFLAGQRAVTRTKESLDREAAISRLLSVGVTNQLPALEKLLSTRSSLEKQGKLLRKTLIDLIAGQVSKSDERLFVFSAVEPEIILQAALSIDTIGSSQGSLIVGPVHNDNVYVACINMTLEHASFYGSLKQASGRQGASVAHGIVKLTELAECTVVDNDSLRKSGIFLHSCSDTPRAVRSANDTGSPK